MAPDSLHRLTIDKSRQTPATARKGKRMRAIVILVLLLVAVAMVVFFSRVRKISIETTTVSQVYPSQSFTLLNASGYVVAQRKAAVASKITGRLEWLGVEEGSRVSSGQVIARLENLDLAAAIHQAEASVEIAKASLEQARAEMADADQSYGRMKELLKQGIVSQADFDTVEARYKRAGAGMSGAKAGVRNSVATLRSATVAFDYSRIRAPFDAVVLTKNADVGDIITPLGAAANAKAAVVTIADMGSLQVEADVSESNLGQVRKGQPCEITLDALPKARFRGSVYTIVPTADRAKASVMVKIRFIDTNADVLPEMSAKVAFLEHETTMDEQQSRTAVNPAAIVKSGNREGVYLVKESRLVFTPITRGSRLGDMVEVAGVKSGDMVALRPLEKLKDGARVTLSEKK
jgi:RND family efflux transporter MFP subunit